MRAPSLIEVEVRVIQGAAKATLADPQRRRQTQSQCPHVHFPDYFRQPSGRERDLTGQENRLST